MAHAEHCVQNSFVYSFDSAPVTPCSRQLVHITTTLVHKISSAPVIIISIISHQTSSSLSSITNGYHHPSTVISIKIMIIINIITINHHYHQQCLSNALFFQRRLRSASTSELIVPRTSRSTIGDRAFCVTAARA